MWDYFQIRSGPGSAPAEYKTDAGNYMVMGAAPIPKGSRIVEAALMKNGNGGSSGSQIQLGIVEGGKPPFALSTESGTYVPLTNAVGTTGGTSSTSLYGGRRSSGGYIVSEEAWMVILVSGGSMWTAKNAKVFCSITYMSI